MSKPSLDAKKTPKDIAPAILFAQQWGIGDDFDREEAVSNATTEELEALAHCLDQIDDATLVAWLTGPESRKSPPSAEYLAITNLTMAVHSAKAKLRKAKH